MSVLRFRGWGAAAVIGIGLAIYAGFRWVVGVSHVEAWLGALTMVVFTELGIVEERETELRRQIVVLAELCRLLGASHVKTEDRPGSAS